MRQAGRRWRWHTGMRWRVVAASSTALALTVAALAVALVAAAGTRSDGRELSQQLVPAAAASVELAELYQAQQTWLRGYVTQGHSAAPDSSSTLIPNVQNRLGQLVSAFPPIGLSLRATVASYQTWLARIAAPQLAAMARGDAAAARASQDNTALVRPYVLAIRSAGSTLQARITAAQQTATGQLRHEQGILLAALVAVCVVVAAIIANGLTAVWLGLLRPFRALRRAVDAVTAGDYDTRIPALGPSELAELARGIELMRSRLVTALAQREKAEQRFRRLFATAPDAMIAVAADGTIAMANDQALRLFDYPSLIGYPVDLLVPEEERGALVEGRKEYFAGTGQKPQPPTTELKLSGLRSDGRQFPAEIALAPLPTGRGMLVVAAIRDVSERLAAEAERERLRAVAEQERLQRRLQQSQRLESLGQLVGGVAHDFNNLLNVIAGYADFTAEQVQPLAEQDPRLGQVLEDIEQVRVAAQQATRLTRQLLTFARHEVNRPEVLDLNETVNGAGQLLRRTLGEHIALTISPAPCLWRVKADRGQLEQVLVNLAVNARDAMPGGGRLTIDTGNVEVDDAYVAQRPALTPGRYVRLRVSDTGTGMDRATADRVFEPFFSTKPKGRGTGLGLATVYGIVTGTGGSIEIYSEPGLGTTMSVLLPVTDEDAVPGPRPGTQKETGGQRGHGETILLVEDEVSLRELTSRILAGAGYEVCLAESGADAVRRAEDPAQPIDLLLTDVVMPEMLGNEVAERIGVIRPGVPALFMSGYAQPIFDTRGVPSAPFDIVEKPFTETELLSRVRKALSRATARP